MAKQTGVVRHMTKPNFFSTLRQVLKSNSEKIKQVRTASFQNLKRLGVKRDLTKAVTEIPEGSDQLNVGSLVDWMAKIQPGDDRAINQLVVIDATCVKRM